MVRGAYQEGSHPPSLAEGEGEGGCPAVATAPKMRGDGHLEPFGELRRNPITPKLAEGFEVPVSAHLGGCRYGGASAFPLAFGERRRMGSLLIRAAHHRGSPGRRSPLRSP